MKGANLQADRADDAATVEDIRQAIEALSETDLLRLRKAAAIHIGGTEYHDPMELVNEAVCRTMSAANGDPGRRWRKSVPFQAYMVQTIRGLSSDSRDGLPQARTRRLEATAADDASRDELMGSVGHCEPDILSAHIEQEERENRRDQAKATTNLIDSHFSDDNEVVFIIMGHKDDMTPAEIRDLGEMTETQYNTARRRFRRGLEKLFQGRR